MNVSVNSRTHPNPSWLKSRGRGWKVGLLLALGGLALSAAPSASAQCVSTTELARLLGSSGETDENFGFSVGISGDTMVVGVMNHNSPADDEGAAYVFVRPAGTQQWDLQAKLVASDAAPLDRFGWSVSISNDVILVGAPYDDNAGGVDAGAVYAFTRTAGVWAQTTKLLASDGAAGDQFGYSVALVGSIAAVGAIGDSVAGGTDQGSAYAFSLSGGVWSQTGKLLASDRLSNDLFGNSVAIAPGTTRNTIVVGAPTHDNAGGTNQGAAYVFTISTLTPGSVWTQQAKLVAPAGQTNDYFGTSVAFAGERAVVGAYGADDGTTTDCGAAFVFSRSLNTWSAAETLIPPDRLAGDGVGVSVAIANGVVYAGTPYRDHGRTSVFEFISDTWQQTAVVNMGSYGRSGAEYGAAVAASGDTLVSGAWRLDTVDGPQSGGVIVHRRLATQWSSPAQIRRPSDRSDHMGFSVAIHFPYAAVGAPLDNTTAADGSGAVYIFQYMNGAWTLRSKLRAPDGATGDRFGHSVAIYFSTLVVGAPNSNNTGAIYVGSATSSSDTGGFIKYTASDGAPGDAFGSSVAIDGSHLVVGAPGVNTPTVDAGAVYFFNKPTSSPTWVQLGRRTSGAVSAELLGTSVAISDSGSVVRAVGGAPGNSAVAVNAGAAYVFTLDSAVSTQWSAGAPLTATGIAFNDQFGTAVDLYVSTIAVGAPLTDGPDGADQGAIYVFDVATANAPIARLLTDDALGGDYLGKSVAIDYNTIVAGAPGADGSNRGEVRVFHRVSSQQPWLDQGSITPADRAPSDNVGNAVAYDGFFPIAGAYLNNTNDTSDTGSAYILDLVIGSSPSIPSNQPANVPSCITGAATFSVTITNELPITYQWQRVRSGGIVQDIPGATNSTLTLDPILPADATWQYRVVVSNGCGSENSRAASLLVCRPDINCDQAINPTDVNIFINSWFLSVNVGDLNADYDGNGAVQPADVSLFVNNWYTALNSGC